MTPGKCRFGSILIHGDSQSYFGPSSQGCCYEKKIRIGSTIHTTLSSWRDVNVIKVMIIWSELFIHYQYYSVRQSVILVVNCWYIPNILVTFKSNGCLHNSIIWFEISLLTLIFVLKDTYNLSRFPGTWPCYNISYGKYHTLPSLENKTL